MKYIKVIALLLALGMIPATPYAAFKATTVAAEGALSQIRNQSATTKRHLITQRAGMITPTVNSLVPLGVIQHLAGVIPRLDALAKTPGLLQYAKDQYNDPTYDVVTEYNTMRAAMGALLTNLITTFPKDSTATYLNYQIMNGVGEITTRTFTAAQVAPAVALIDAFLATVD